MTTTNAYRRDVVTNTIVRHALAILLFGLTVNRAAACVVCSVPKQSLLDRMEASSDIVIATQTGDSETRWHVDQVIKGSRAQVGQNLISGQTVDEPAANDQRILNWNPLGQFWTDLGVADKQFLSFAARAHGVSQNRSPTASRQTKVQQLQFFVPYLEHENDLIADAAYSRIASASYPVLCLLGKQFTPERLIGWMDRQPRDTSPDQSRKALYITLLGICGERNESKLVDRWLTDLWNQGSSDELAAILTAHGELHGDRTVDLIELQYIHNPDRSLPEIIAAVNALRVHGDANRAISRNRVLAAFHGLLRHRTPLLELVIEDFRRWQDWSITPLLMEVYATGKQPWNHNLIQTYLAECPLPEAAKFVAKIR